MTVEEREAARILFVYHDMSPEAICQVLPVTPAELSRTIATWTAQRTAFQTLRESPAAKVDRMLRENIQRLEWAYADTGKLPDAKVLIDLKHALTRTGVNVDTASTVLVMFEDFLTQQQMEAEAREAVQRQIASFLKQLDVTLLLQGQRQIL